MAALQCWKHWNVAKEVKASGVAGALAIAKALDHRPIPLRLQLRPAALRESAK